MEAQPKRPKEKVMSYEEKSVGSTLFFKCEACPYMALAEDDIKFHLFTVHPELARSNGLADNVQIPCPGCTSVFDAEETLRTHLRNHHKMGIKDIRKMIKSLVQIALKNAKLKKEDKSTYAPPVQPHQNITDLKIPQVIEIVPDIVTGNNEPLPRGVTFISMDELQKMSSPNFEKIDPKDIIQDASINIVYTNEVSTQYVNVSDANSASAGCNVIQVSNVPPDLISSIQPRVTATDITSSPQIMKNNETTPHSQSQIMDSSKLITYSYTEVEVKNKESEKTHNVSHSVRHSHKHLSDELSTEYHRKSHQNDNMSSQTKSQISEAASFTRKYNNEDESRVSSTMELGKTCSIGNCMARFKDENNLQYHRKCHQNGKFQCPECARICLGVDSLHTHLWKEHTVDMEMPTCEICGFKTYKKSRLLNIHMKCHGDVKAYSCSICQKSFKNTSQLSKHKLIHSRTVQCQVCQLEFSNLRRLKGHVAAVHEKLKPFKCCQCEYTAARKSELKLHLRSHSGDKPYSCDMCSFRASDHNSMRRHKKLHTKQSLYKCKFCPYTAIQSNIFTYHMMNKHPTINTDIHCCPYCTFKTVNKDKYAVHLTTHRDKEGIQCLIDMTKSIKPNKQTKPTWTIPSETSEKPNEVKKIFNEQKDDSNSSTVNNIPIEVFDCDSLSGSIPQDYPKNYCTTPSSDTQSSGFPSQVLVTDLSKEDNNSDCLISESSNDTMMERHQYPPELPLQMTYDTSQNNLHFLNPSVSIDDGLLQSNNVDSLASSHSPISNSISNNIMSNFPIRLPLAPPISLRNNVTLKAVDKICFPMTKVTGPIIKPTQILPVPSSSHSPINMSNESDGLPRKKAKISVKSNLILKGPDQVNMFHSQQKMAFKRLEDNERFGLESPVTFNNLITTQFMQLPPEPTLSESPNNIIPYPQENMLEDTATTPVDDGINTNPQIFSFNQQINVNTINTMTILPPPQKIQTNDPNYIKTEATIKQNTQSPSLERMCNANLMNNQAINREYKASPPLEDMNKNMREIKNEVKSDTFYTMALNNSAANPPIIDQYLIDNIIPEQYPSLLDLSAVVLPEISDQQNDVIEIDDNSDDNKLLSRFDMTFPLESLYLMHNDFHFLDNETPVNNMGAEVPVSEMNRMVSEVPLINQKETLDMLQQDGANGDFTNYIQGKKDPMMTTPVRASTNKINVKNIELMKN